MEKPREVNQRALYSGRGTEASSGEGESEGNQNQGSTNGSSDNSSHFIGSAGGGTEFSLAGRQKLVLSEPRLNLQKEGKVVVEITVDRAGNVINAVPGVQGSTTLDSDLLKLAKQAALKSKFSEKSDAAYAQKGTITYYFKLR